METKYAKTCPDCQENEGTFEKEEDKNVWFVRGFTCVVSKVEFEPEVEVDLPHLINIMSPKCVCSYELKPEDGKVWNFETVH